jgi:hypothetical protein
MLSDSYLFARIARSDSANALQSLDCGIAIALVTHPASPYKGLCGLKETRCDWDESEGGLRGCETIELPIPVSVTRN